MYTTDFPKPGNENMASRGFGWTGVSMLSFYVSNFSMPNRTFYAGKLVALQVRRPSSTTAVVLL